MTQGVEVTVHQRKQSFRLLPGWNDISIDEAPCLLRVTGAIAVRLNGKLLENISGSDDLLLCPTDFSNAVGSHDLSVSGVRGSVESFAFDTSSRKLIEGELDAMVDVCAEHVFGNDRQFVYQASTGQRAVAHSSKSLVRWLDTRLPEVADIVSSIDISPGISPQVMLLTSPRPQRLDLRATSAYLRSNPALLEPSVDGPVLIDGRHFTPALVKVRSVAKGLPIVEHKQVQSWLKEVLRVIASVWAVAKQPPSAVAAHEKCVGRLLTLRALSSPMLGQAATSVLDRPTALQRSDARYRRLREIMIEFRSMFARSTPDADSIRANLKDIWEIYQTYVCHIVGMALGLCHASSDRDLRKRDRNGASMVSRDRLLFFDASPPKALLRSWRSDTIRPAGERPDILVVDKAAKRCLLLDAKFSVDGSDRSRCRSEHLFEMQGYLNSYRLNSGGIVFPGHGGIRGPIESGGFSLLEIPLRPLDVSSKRFGDVLSEVAVALESLWTPLAEISI